MRLQPEIESVSIVMRGSFNPAILYHINVEREWGIQISTTALWHFLRRGGFRQKVPRPVHAKADPVAQEAFKKNC